MLLQKILIIVFSVLMLSGTVAFSPVITNQIGTNAVDFTVPEKIMSQYYLAVDRGELVVFGVQLERSMLIPVHVDYVYPVNGKTARVKVYARLKNPMRIPEQGNNMFTGVCAFIDMFGKITETEAHIILK